MPKLRCGSCVCLILIAGLSSIALAQAPVTDDTFVSSATPNTNNGTSPSMVVQAPGGWSFIKFDLTQLPAGTTSGSVSKATVKLYATAVTAQGSFDVFRVDSSWAENTLTYSNTTTPFKSALALTLTPVTTGNCGATPVQCVTTQSKYVIVDVTSIVKQWIDFKNSVGGFANNGIAFKPTASSSISVTFESKESTTTSHDSDLNIVLASNAGVASVTAFAPLSITGTAANPNIELSGLIPSGNLGGTYAISITGSASTAGSATSATTATTATNTTQLGGIAAANYARVDQANTFTGVNILGNSTAGTGGLLIPPSGTGVNKNSFLMSLQSTGASATNTFGFQATAIPSLSLMFCNSSATCAPAATGLSIASNGVITFAPGQTFPGSGSGTVTSFSISGNLSPLFTTSVANPTSTPTLSFNLNTQGAHSVFAGPASGTAAPTFRALLAGDIPSLPESQITNLTTDLAGLQSNLTAETSRATGAESTIAGNLNSEITRAQNAEGTEAASRATTDVALSASVLSEAGRATTAEGGISTSLGNEVSRATAAEATKADLVKPVQLDNTAMTNGSCAVVNALVLNPTRPSGQQLFICRDIGSNVFQWQLINDDSTTSSAANTYTDQQVTAEATARQAANTAEAAARIAGDAATLTSANQYTDTSVASEATARIVGDAATLSSANSHADTAVAAEAASRATADAMLGASIAAETSRAQGAETTLQTNIDNLSSSSAKLTTDNMFTGKNTFTGKVDLSGSSATLPIQTTNTQPVVSGSPNACVAGQMLLYLGGQPGQQLFICNSTLNGWTMVNDDTATTASDHTYTDSQVAAEAAARTSADTAEVAARQAADTTLQSNIDAEAAARAAADTAETSRATASETSISNSVSAESVRAMTAETALGASIGAEMARATSAEATITSNLNSEIFRATAAEATKADLVKPVQLDNTAMSNGSCAVVNALVLNPTQLSGQQLFVCRDIGGNTLQWQLINDDSATTNSANAYTDSQVAAEAAARQAADTAETNRATSAENTITSNLSNEISRATTAETAETSRATTAETALGGAISAEVSRATSAESTLNGAITTETTRATAAEATKANLAGGNVFTGGSQALAASAAGYASLNVPNSSTPPSNPAIGDVWLTNLDPHLRFQDATNVTQNLAFSSDVTAANSAVTASLNNEITRATAAESTLTSNLTNEISRATSAETTLQGNIGSEAATRTAAETALGVTISAEVSRATSAESTLSGSITTETTRATAAEATKANLAGGNIFTGGSQVLAASAAGYASLNVPNSSTPPSTPAVGDVWLINTDKHLQFHDKDNATHSLMFTDDTISNSQLSNSSINVTLSSGLSGSSSVALGGTLSLNNTGVLSFKGRSGSVIPASGDYLFSQISGAITPAQAGPGTYAIDISGNAATATLAASATNAGNASLLSGETAATAATASTIAARDASGDLFANAFHGSGASLTNIPSSALPATIVYNNQANIYTAGSKQTFKASSTLAGLNVFGVAADPTSPLASGDAWFNLTSNHLRFFDGTTTHSLAFSDDNITGNAANVTGIVAIANGGTGASTAAAARTNLGAGTVTSVATGAGLTGGPITTSGTISIPNAGVTNAMLANSSVAVSAGTGLIGGGAVSLGSSTTLNLANTAVTAGTYTAASVTVDAQGRITSASSNTIPTVPSPTAQVVATSQARSNTAYGDLTTVGPTVTVNVSSGQALVTVTSLLSNGNNPNTGCFAGFAISGATIVAASDTQSVRFDSYKANGNGAPDATQTVQMSATYLVTSLTAGSNTFTVKYRSSGANTCTFANRNIIVIPY